MSYEYNRDDLSDDLAAMVKAGLLDIGIREDGEWVYMLSEKAVAMSDEEREEALLKMYEDDEI